MNSTMRHYAITSHGGDVVAHPGEEIQIGGRPGLPEGQADAPKGVVYASPPPDILPTISSQIDEFIKGLPDGQAGTFVLDITTDRGINGAIVARRDGVVDLGGAVW